MPSSPSFSSAARALFVLAAFFIVAQGIQEAGSLLVQLLLAIYIAVICASPLGWMVERKVPVALAVLVLMITLISIGFGLVMLLSGSIDKFSQDIPLYQSKLRTGMSSIVVWLQGMHVPISSEDISKVIDPGKTMSLVGALLNGLGAVLTDTMVILLTVVFILFEATGFTNKLDVALTDKDTGYLQRIAEGIRGYMVIKTFTSLITGVLVGLLLWGLNVDYPVLWAVLAFLFNYIPNIGSIIAAVPAVLLSSIQLGVQQAMFVALGYVCINMLVGNALEPKLMGKGMGLSVLVVFVSLMFWGWLLGPVGVLLSVPLTMSLKIILENNPETRWIAIMLGPDNHVPKK
ncbi:MAG: AI-2E family transporter [Pseudomonadales bacterium]|nr:AI-2E family transporter [Pseudomonadales bacterium]